MKKTNFDRRNLYCFGLGTVGRDMFYTMVSMYLLFYITDVLIVSDSTLLMVTAVLTGLRIFDAVNDPIMGVIVDNTRSRFGKFKPGILIGALIASVAMFLMFVDLGLSGTAYVVGLVALYLVWDISFGLNDIAYWSMMPSLSTEQKQREKMGAFARICANVGLFAVVVAIIPATNSLGRITGSLKSGWAVFALIIVLLMLGFQAITLFGVKEKKGFFKEEEKTPLREMFRVLFRNDQLLWVAVAMSLFMIGYMTTTSFGVYFFKYAYGNEEMYSIFAAVLGVSQLTALSVFPLFRKKLNRKNLYRLAILTIGVGYIIFFFSPMNMAYIGVAGVMIFVGQAFIQLLMLMFLADTIEYGQWKLGKRNESITFSVQPFINKIGGAVANGVIGVTLVVSGINAAETAADVAPAGITILKVAMLLLPFVLITLGYLVYVKKYTIDEVRHQQLVEELKERGDIDSNS
ncbi:MAG: glycoside-pentoside-hexuronide (GPH):cation symporter [Lachnospiraceae bacterium]|nr:glycoside-pentoside-hexuronide (GPH):cation symporter [Lachnospiraceae bacterium]